MDRLQSPTAAAASSADGADGSAPAPASASSLDHASLRLQSRDVGAALTSVKPSAMRTASLVIDVPRVAWTDIGGQDVKQKLKEAVDWPLMVSVASSTTGGESGADESAHRCSLARVFLADIALFLSPSFSFPSHFVQHPEAFLRLGIQPPKGILLYGPPVSATGG